MIDRPLRWTYLLLFAVGSGACSYLSPPESESGEGIGVDVSGSAGMDEDGTGGEDAGETASGDGATSFGTDAGDDGVVTDGMAVEICDGIDNDFNGIIDDVDEGGDGICDCIRIATIGLAGQWGNGDIFADWLSSRSSTGAVDLADQVLTAETLAGFQVIVIQNVNPDELERVYTEDEIDALYDWVANGGGLMTLIGYAGPSERDNVNALLAPMDLGYGPEQILPRGGGPTVPVTAWYEHPVAEEISAVGVDNGYPVMGTGTVFAHEGGYDVGIATTIEKGRVALWGDEWITYDSEWQGMPNPDVEYQVERFWLNMIKWLTPPNECQVVIPVVG